MTFYEQWEYMTKFCIASIENKGAQEYLKKKFPNWNKPPKFAPQTMIPELNDLGSDGWELVHMEPVERIGENFDVGFISGEQLTPTWSNIYFCVFKRRTIYPK